MNESERTNLGNAGWLSTAIPASGGAAGAPCDRRKIPLANPARALCFYPLHSCKRRKNPSPSASSLPPAGSSCAARRAFATCSPRKRRNKNAAPRGTSWSPKATPRRSNAAFPSGFDPAGAFCNFAWRVNRDDPPTTNPKEYQTCLVSPTPPRRASAARKR